MGQDGTKEPGYAAVAGRITRDIGQVLRSEALLVRAEARTVVPRLARDALLLSVAVFGLAVSVLPLVAFLVIGLGRLLGENYWLSSLLVGLLGLAGCGAAAYALVQKIKAEDLDLPESKRAIQQSARAIGDKVAELRPKEGRSAV